MRVLVSTLFETHSQWRAIAVPEGADADDFAVQKWNEIHSEDQVKTIDEIQWLIEPTEWFFVAEVKEDSIKPS